MADEVKPPKDESTGAPRRPRKPRAKKPVAKKSADDATRVIAGKAGEAETQVVPPDAAATREIPEPPRPPFAPVPRTVEKTGGAGRRIPVWLVIVLAAVAIAAVALAWAYTRRGGGEEFVGDWAPADGRGGGLVVSLAGGDFTVAMYDESLGLLGSYPAARDGDVLTFDFADVEGENGRATATLTYDEERDVLTMRLTGADVLLLFATQLRLGSCLSLGAACSSHVLSVLLGISCLAPHQRTFFLPATAFFLPLRVRALVRVR